MDQERLRVLAAKHGIRLVLQFGSTVSGREHAGSDVDLAVLLDEAAGSIEQWLALTGDLQALIPGREADVAILNRADPLFLKQIVERAHLVYGSRRTFQELKIYAFKRYQDHRRFLAMERDYVARRVAAFGR